MLVSRPGTYHMGWRRDMHACRPPARQRLQSLVRPQTAVVPAHTDQHCYPVSGRPCRHHRGETRAGRLTDVCPQRRDTGRPADRRLPTPDCPARKGAPTGPRTAAVTIKDAVFIVRGRLPGMDGRWRGGSRAQVASPRPRRRRRQRVV